jgi:hypothetical protein
LLTKKNKEEEEEVNSSVMDASLSEGLDSPPKDINELEAETQASKKRKVVEKTVVRVKIEGNDQQQQQGKQRSEGPPSDCWSWRKYGQKPIKGSPYPRGYYRCSTSKGCSAKKQVERCRTDASMLVITYTSTHNHPGPDPINPTTETTQIQPTKEPKEEEEEEQQQRQEEEEEAEKEQEPKDSQEEDANEDHLFHYSQSPFNSSQDMITMSKREEDPFDDDGEPITSVLLEEKPLLCFPPPPLLSFSSNSQLKSEENDHDFYDELEELPSSSSSSSSFTSNFLRTSNFFDDRILVYPS